MGSSRSNGNTAKVATYVQEQTGFDVIDLKQFKIGHFDYAVQDNDDFRRLFKMIVDQYDSLIFATPIYWYTMSGIMKVFFDRISDFLFVEKDEGRKLRGKNMAVISCGSDHEVFEGFEMPFKQSATYLGMHYIGHVHTYIKNEQIPVDLQHSIDRFIREKLTANATNS